MTERSETGMVRAAGHSPDRMLSCGRVSEDLILTIGTEPERIVEYLEQKSEPV